MNDCFISSVLVGMVLTIFVGTNIVMYYKGQNDVFTSCENFKAAALNNKRITCEVTTK